MLRAMQARDRERLAEAFRFALEAHAEQTRKGSGVPYVSHLLQVAGLVLEHGGDATLAVAGVLHDALEDCEGVDREALRARFGEEVACIVEACSDLLPQDRPGAKGDWELRKRSYLARLREADARTRLVAACDKVHNLRSLVADLRAEGAAALERFRATPAQTRWYFESARASLCDDLPERLIGELDLLLEGLRGFVPDPSAEQRD
jgi:(p)ppGpp synthase/HD superfamily hydrolase